MDSPWQEVDAPVLQKAISSKPCQVWWKRIKRLTSPGSGKKRGLHFDLPVPVAKDLIRKPIDNNLKIILVQIGDF
jgi:hypothetical protein